MLLNTAEMESAMRWLESKYPTVCRRVQLPHRTHEGATVHALRIGTPDAPGAMIIGGVHAREWGGPDICLQFARDLLGAYSVGKGLEYGGTRFEAAALRRLVETTEIVVFPCVNPDGYTFSRTVNPAWRKNRNRDYYDGANPSTVGADVNRNYDFLWDFRKHFHPTAVSDHVPASDDRRSEFYHGPAPFSENETRNVRWLLDEHPNVGRFVDVHSVAGTMLYSWGHDDNQTTDPTKRFTNPGFDGKRGLRDAEYLEYIAPDDLEQVRAVAASVVETMKGARSRPYVAAQSVSLLGWYPTSGASDDYAYSRHIVDPARPKTLGFTMEFNFSSEGFTKTAEPAVLHQTMLEVVPGLIQFCLTAVPPLIRPPEAPGTIIRIVPGRDGNGVFTEVSGAVVTLPNGRQIALPPIRIYLFGPGPVRPGDPHRGGNVFAELATLVHDAPARQALQQAAAEVLELALREGSANSIR